MSHGPPPPIAGLLPPGARQFRDDRETRVADWLRPWDGRERLDRLDAGFVGVPLSRASISHSGASATPAALRELFAALTTYDLDRDVDLAERLVARDLGDVRVHPTDVARAQGEVRDTLAALFAALPRFVPVIAGGDHSITASALPAFAERAGGRVGLVQLDAHMDVRELAAGPTNGTPVRRLLESGAVAGRNVAQVGLQNFANARAYRDFARAHGVTQLTAGDVARGGIAPAVERALAVASADTAAVYVTLDVDVVAQAAAPGVAAPVPAGLGARELLDAMLLLGRHPRVAALDVVEIDATLDPRRASARLALHAILTFLVGLATRPNVVR